MIYTTHKQTCNFLNKEGNEKPIDLSDFHRLDELSFKETGPSDDEVGHVWPVTLATCDTHGWSIVASICDPRLARDDTWDDRVIGVGETVAAALDQADEWAADKPRMRPHQGTN